MTGVLIRKETPRMYQPRKKAWSNHSCQSLGLRLSDSITVTNNYVAEAAQFVVFCYDSPSRLIQIAYLEFET